MKYILLDFISYEIFRVDFNSFKRVLVFDVMEIVVRPSVLLNWIDWIDNLGMIELSFQFQTVNDSWTSLVYFRNRENKICRVLDILASIFPHFNFFPEVLFLDFLPQNRYKPSQDLAEATLQERMISIQRLAISFGIDRHTYTQTSCYWYI